MIFPGLPSFFPGFPGRVGTLSIVYEVGQFSDGFVGHCGLI